MSTHHYMIPKLKSQGMIKKDYCIEMTFDYNYLMYIEELDYNSNEELHDKAKIQFQKWRKGRMTYQYNCSFFELNQRYLLISVAEKFQEDQTLRIQFKALSNVLKRVMAQRSLRGQSAWDEEKTHYKIGGQKASNSTSKCCSFFSKWFTSSKENSRKNLEDNEK